MMKPRSFTLHLPKAPDPNVLGEAFELEVKRVCSERGDWKLLQVEAGGCAFSAVGVMPDLVEGDHVQVTGAWETYRGKPQFKVLSYLAMMPSTTAGVEQWLQHRLPEVGPKRAAVLVQTFGVPGVWEMLEEDPQQATRIEGITPERATQLGEAYLLYRQEREIMSWLYGLGLTQRQAIAAGTTWGANVRDVLTDDPYLLTELDGIGFGFADRIARQHFEMDLHDPRRVAAGLYYVVKTECFQRGHTYLAEADAMTEAAKTLSLSVEEVRAGFVPPARGLFVGDGVVTTIALDDAERTIAAGVNRRLS